MNLLPNIARVGLACLAAFPLLTSTVQASLRERFGTPEQPGATGLADFKGRKAPTALPAAQPRGSFWGVVASFQGIQTNSQHYWGQIDPVTGTVTPVFNAASLASSQDYDIQGGAVRQGILYVPEVTGGGISGAPEAIIWRRFEVATGRELSPVNFGNDYAAYAYSMTYDPDNDLFHILSLDQASFSFGVYATIDPQLDFKVTQHGLPGMGLFLGSVVYNPADRLVYVFDQTNGVCTIDPATKSLVEMGTVDEDYTLVRYQTATAMAYSPLDRSFVAFYPDQFTQSIKLLFIDGETFEVTESAALSPSNPYLSVLYCADPYAALEAPAMPEAPVALFDGPALSGSLTVTAPQATYGRLPLNTDVRMVCTVDGTTVLDRMMAPGASETVAWAGEEGVHQVSLRSYAGTQASPECLSTFCNGHDMPAPPAGLTVNGTEVTWLPSTATGANGGYVDTSDLTYDIFENGTRLNDQPLTQCRWTLDDNRTLTGLDITVTATAHGKTSQPATAFTSIGRALAMPVSLKPSADEFRLFTPLDANDDGATFDYAFDYSEGKWYVTLDLTESNQRADDWVWLPAIDFATPSQQYELRFSARNFSIYDGDEELAVYVGDAPTPQAMTKCLFSSTDMRYIEDTTVTLPFAVAGEGSRWIGFHSTTRTGYGVRLGNFKVSALDGTSSHVPDAPQAVLTPAPKGALSLNLQLTAPTADLIGEPLPAGEAVEFAITCGHHTANASALPGQTANIDIPVDRSGTATVSVTPSNSKGSGLVQQHSAYVGIDRPLAPRNITYSTSDDNMQLTVTWDAPDAVGEHGGYVDTDALEYRIYTVEAVTFNHIATVTDCTYTFTATSPDLHRYVVGPAAVNEAGESRYSPFDDEVLGRPYAIPLTDEFSTGGFMYNPVWYNMSGQFDNSAVESTSTVAGMGTGATTDLADGGLVIYNMGTLPTQAQLVLPKVSTAGSRNPAFRLRWLDWAHTPEFSLWGRRSGAETLVKLADFTPQRPARGQWRDDDVILTDGFENSGWAEFRVHARLSSDINEYGFIDSWSMVQMVDRDFKIAQIDGPAEALVGDEATFQVRVLNAGAEVMGATLSTRLLGAAGQVLYENDETVRRLQPGRDYLKNIRITLTAEHMAASPLTLEATVTPDEDDEVPANNTLTHTLHVLQHQAPVVTDLTAMRNGEDNSVALSWSQPDLTYGGTEGFELAEPFVHTSQLGQWTNHDLDGLPVFGIDGLPWEGNTDPRGWIAVDAAKLGVMTDDRLAPHSGHQYLMARTIQFDENDPTSSQQASDWLVSPEVVGGTEVSFWYGTISPDYTEYIEIWWSEEEPSLGTWVQPGHDDDGNIEQLTEFGSFHYLRTYSKEGEEAWEQCTFRLPAKARYFAFRYASIDSFAAMLDDIEFTPAQLSVWDLEGYTVHRTIEGVEESIAGGITDTAFTDTTGLGRAAAYTVSTTILVNGRAVEGPRSNTAWVDAAGVAAPALLEGIYGLHGAIMAEGLEGHTLAFYTSDGRHTAQLQVTSDRFTHPMPAGAYIAKCGNAVAKIIVK